MRVELIDVWEKAVGSLSGERLVSAALASLDPPIDPSSCVTIALGKASASMLAGAAQVLGTLRGLAVLEAPAPVPDGIMAHVGDHPLPGPGSMKAGVALLAAVEGVAPTETALVLLSGGGSALAEVLPEELGWEELAATTQALMAAGCSIQELNLVRRALSRLKGGKLLLACRARRIEVLTISDVEGDDPAVIASGPFWPAAVGAKDALEVIRSSHATVPGRIRSFLEEEASRPARPRPSQERGGADPRLRNTILAGPRDLQAAAIEELSRRGWHPTPWPGFVHQDVDDVARQYLHWLETASGERPVLVGVGEPVLRLPPNPGSGGRSQHLALRMAVGLEGRDAAFLAAGSDGRDGPTDNAGACVDGKTAAIARSRGIDLEQMLRKADSATAAEALSLALPSRATGTNLTDLHLLAKV